MAFSITTACIGCTNCVRVCPVHAIEGRLKAKHTIRRDLCIECGACGRVCPVSAVVGAYDRPVGRVAKEHWERPLFSYEYCAVCEKCVEHCPTGALTMVRAGVADQLNNKQSSAGQTLLPVLTAPEKCVSCGWCVEYCAFHAIVLIGPVIEPDKNSPETVETKDLEAENPGPDSKPEQQETVSIGISGSQENIQSPLSAELFEKTVQPELFSENGDVAASVEMSKNKLSSTGSLAKAVLE